MHVGACMYACVCMCVWCVCVCVCVCVCACAYANFNKQAQKYLATSNLFRVEGVTVVSFFSCYNITTLALFVEDL